MSEPLVIPNDLLGLYADAQMDSTKPWHWMQVTPTRMIALIERIATQAQQIQAQQEELALWRSEHDPCPFAMELEAVKADVTTLREALNRIKHPRIYVGKYYATVEVPEICPDCDGRNFISHGPKAMICHTCSLLQANEELETDLSTLQATVARLSAPVSDEESVNFGWLIGDRYRFDPENVDALIASRATSPESQPAKDPDYHAFIADSMEPQHCLKCWQYKNFRLHKTPESQKEKG